MGRKGASNSLEGAPTNVTLASGATNAKAGPVENALFFPGIQLLLQVAGDAKDPRERLPV